MNKNGLGALGEDYACEVLKTHGYSVLDRNFRSRFGELDIVARKEGYLCFVEVKTRSERSIGRPAESVTPSKQKKIMKTAEYYIVRHPSLLERDGLQPRFDCIEVFASEDKPVAYEYIKNAFSAN